MRTPGRTDLPSREGKLGGTQASLPLLSIDNHLQLGSTSGVDAGWAVVAKLDNQEARADE